MSDIRRYYVPGAPVFLTIVCQDRVPFLASAAAKALLLDDLRATRHMHPFRMHAYVVLDDHVHVLVTPERSNFSDLVRDWKARFAYSWAQRFNNGIRRRVWQLRYWDHVVRDAGDMRRHVDYVHYNPVKHGCTNRASAYACSSLASHIERGWCAVGWGDAEPESIRGMEHE